MNLLEEELSRRLDCGGVISDEVFSAAYDETKPKQTHCLTISRTKLQNKLLVEVKIENKRGRKG